MFGFSSERIMPDLLRERLSVHQNGLDNSGLARLGGLTEWTKYNVLWGSRQFSDSKAVCWGDFFDCPLKESRRKQQTDTCRFG